MPALRIALAVAVALLAACGGRAPDEPPAAEPTGACAPEPTEAEVVARVDGQPVTAAELDAPLRLALHDLDVARWELRSAALARRLAGRTDIRVSLAPPAPPVVDAGPGDAAVRGVADAPVTVVEFLDYQSPACRRVEPIVERLRADYGERVRFAVRNFPQPGHRDARRAAEAVACAGEQGRFWELHDALLRGSDDLSRAALDHEAERLGLDTDELAECLDDGGAADGVAADAADAHRLGVPRVPAFFVNGRYLGGTPSYEAFQRLVDAELVRIGVAPPATRSTVDPNGAERSTLPFTLVGTVVHDDPAESTAMFRLGAGLPRVLGIGDQPIPGVVIERIEGGRVYVRREDGRLEYLPVAVGDAP